MPAPAPRHVVYRVDFRPPAVIFREGFRPRGHNLSLMDHLSGISTYGQHSDFTHNSGFISTAGRRAAAVRIAYANARAWETQHTGTSPMLYLYEIRGTPDMYSPRVPIENYLTTIRDNQQLRNFWLMRLANEVETEEWVANAAISAVQIHRAYAITFSARGELPAVADTPLATNAQYVEESTTTSSTILPLTRSADTPWYMPGRRFFDRVPVAFAACFTSPPAGHETVCDTFEPTRFMNDKYDFYALLFDSDAEL